MSYHSAKTAPFPSDQFPDHTELAERIRNIEEATQALLAMYAPMEKQHDAGSRPVSDSEGETRSYYFSPSIVAREQELLKKYNAEDFRGLLAEADMLLVGLVKLLKSTHPDLRIKGHILVSLGCLLEQASSLVFRMRNLYRNVERVTQ